MANPAGYTRLQIALHWIAALLVAQQYLFKEKIGSAWEAIGKGLEVPFDPLILAHVAGGAAVMIFALWRISIKARRGVPAMIGESKAQQAVARLTHLGLYALMILMPISGSLAWFGGVEIGAQVHNILKVALLALVALHVVGALYHQFILKDGLLNRMRRAEG